MLEEVRLMKISVKRRNRVLAAIGVTAGLSALVVPHRGNAFQMVSVLVGNTNGRPGDRHRRG